jgi:hypothetical protein
VDFLVPEEQLPAIQERMRNGELSVNATIPGNSSRSSTGKLLFVDNAADTETEMVALRAHFANDDETLWPDETVEATFTLATVANAVVVPSSAVRLGLAGNYIRVVRPDLIVERRPVTIGSPYEKETIVTSGIQAGESLQVSRLPPAREGAYHPATHLPMLPSSKHCKSTAFIRGMAVAFVFSCGKRTSRTTKDATELSPLKKHKPHEHVYQNPYWVPGYWSWNGGWIWTGGNWMIRPWPGAVWVGGRWARHGWGYGWVSGHWR